MCKVYSLFVFLLEPITCKLNIKKLVIVCMIKKTSDQRLVEINKMKFLFIK